jgi:hypothetical protein
MIKLLWFIDRPETDIAGFEQWYQDEHIPIGMRQDFLQRFRVCRSFYPQPPFVTRSSGSDLPRAYRFSEGYWTNMDDIRRCYVSVHGRAALADGMLNRTAPSEPRPPSPVLPMREESFPVLQGLSFDWQTGRYRGELACKLFGFVRLKDGAAEAFDAGYRALAAAAAADPDLGGHVVGHTLDEVVRPGRAAQWPPVGAESFDRSLEYYFDSRQAMDRFCESEFMTRLAPLMETFASAHIWDAAQIQEVFFTTKGQQPLEESWLSLYR